MNWLVIATIAYFLIAIANITDKFLVSKRLEPVTYAFFIALFSGVMSLILIPFGFYWLGIKLLIIDLLSGFSFIIGLIFLFTALEKKETSRIFPITGGLQPIIILFLAYFFLSEKLTPITLVAFIIIVLGSFLISVEEGREKIGRPAIYFVISAAFAIALSFTLEKFVYQNHPFISGFIWNRFGNLLAAAILIIHSPTRKNIIKAIRAKPKLKSKKGTFKIFFFGQVCGGLGAFLQRYAIKLGSVSLVSALQGTHYVFLLILTSILSIKFPKILKEKISGRILVQKIIAILLIGLGVFILAINQ